MNCLSKSPTPTHDSTRAPLVVGDVLDDEHAGRGDLPDWMELMEAVEVLCPVWPVRDVVGGGVYKL